MKKDLINLYIKGIYYGPSEAEEVYTLILEAHTTKEELHISITNEEAQIVSSSLEEDILLPHKLFLDILKSNHTTFDYIYIYQFSAGIFKTIIITNNSTTGETMKFESTVGEAITISLLTQVPIYTNSTILETCGVILKDGIETSTDQNTTSIFANLSATDLEILLAETLENENYELAAQIRDEIKNKTS